MAKIKNFIENRFPSATAQTFNLRNIFILPTFYTFFLGLLLILLWVMSVQFLLNLGYFLVFLLVGLIIISMMKTYRNLDGISISSGEFLPVFAGEVAGLTFELNNLTNNNKGSVEIKLADKVVESEEILANNKQKIVIPFQTTRRGIITIPSVCIRSVLPVGLFLVWSYFNSAKKIMVFPKPIFTPLPLANDSKGEDKGLHEVAGKEEIVGVREYQNGDSLNLLSWKHLIQREIMISKLTVEATGGKTLQFHWNQTSAIGDDEYRLSQLCGWVVMAHQNNDSFGIVLPNQTIPIDNGGAHLRRCLEALASF